MSNIVEKTGKTIQEAIQAALDEMNLNENEVDIEIVEEGNKGIFGIIGNKVAKVRVTPKPVEDKKASDFLRRVLENMGVNAEIEYEEDEESITLRIKGKDIGIIIGRRGETLDSLQYLTSLVVNKGSSKYKRVILDIENYRQKREDSLVKLANRLAEKVVKYRRPVTLEPMNPYERRVIHYTLQTNKYVDTYSVGEDPNRKIIIKLK